MVLLWLLQAQGDLEERNGNFHPYWTFTEHTQSYNQYSMQCKCKKSGRSYASVSATGMTTVPGARQRHLGDKNSACV